MRIFILITLIAIVIFGIIFLLRGQILGTTDQTTTQPTTYPEYPAGEQGVTTVPDPAPRPSYSDERFLQDVSTSQLTDEGLFRNSSSNEQYVIYYFEPTADVSISLYAEPLQLARTAAENQLRLLLQLSDEQLCEIGVEVTVDRYISEAFKNQNLGLSFCPGAVAL